MATAREGRGRVESARAPSRTPVAQGAARARAPSSERATPRGAARGVERKRNPSSLVGRARGRTRGDRRAHLAEELPRARLRLGEAAGEDRRPRGGAQALARGEPRERAPQRHRKWPGEESTRQQRRRQTGARVGRNLDLASVEWRGFAPRRPFGSALVISLPAAHRSPSSPAMSNGWASSPPQVRDPLGARPPPPSLAPRADPPLPRGPVPTRRLASPFPREGRAPRQISASPPLGASPRSRLFP